MKKSVFRILILQILLLSTDCLKAQERNTQDYKEKYSDLWIKRMPKYTKLQFAGSMGMFSLGPGWQYGKNHWETDLLFGIIPKNSNLPAMLTITLKQNYLPFQVPIKNRFMFEPLTCGIYLNSTLHRDFWIFAPSRYPGKYYGFTTKLRIHAFTGQRITYKFDGHKSLTFFYEISTCELYLISAFENKSLKPKDYLSFSLGIKFQFL